MFASAICKSFKLGKRGNIKEMSSRQTKLQPSLWVNHRELSNFTNKEVCEFPGKRNGLFVSRRNCLEPAPSRALKFPGQTFLVETGMYTHSIKSSQRKYFQCTQHNCFPFSHLSHNKRNILLKCDSPSFLLS